MFLESGEAVLNKFNTDPPSSLIPKYLYFRGRKIRFSSDDPTYNEDVFFLTIAKK